MMAAMSAIGPDAHSSWQFQPETKALRLLQTAMADAEVALARRMAMNLTDLTAMGHLTFAAQPMGPRELSEHLGITPAAATDLVDRLERAGHLERHRDTVDRRRVHLIPTTSALDQVAKELRPLIAMLDAVVERYGDAERDAVSRYLGDVLGVYDRFAHESPVSA
jgi:DNA-binding MarR family transcriptional regulator